MSLGEELLYGDVVEEIPEPAPLIDGVLDLDSTALLYGPSGAGKSFVALDWALCVATGTPWHGRKVRQGRVLYVVGEGLSGTRGRYHAWKDHHGVTDDIPEIAFAPRAVNILRREGREELYEAVANVDPTLVLLDTVARHIAGGDENTFAVMSMMVETLDEIKVHTAGCALGVHHSGKNEDAGARGHSSLRGAMDTEIHCTAGPKLTATKQQSHGDGHIIGTFTLEPLCTSMILAERNPKSNLNDELAVRALGQLEGLAYYNLWRSTAVELGLPRGSFPRTVERLLGQGIVIPETDPPDTSLGQKWYRLA